MAAAVDNPQLGGHCLITDWAHTGLSGSLGQQKSKRRTSTFFASTVKYGRQPIQ
jgi:hypothetical protein